MAKKIGYSIAVFMSKRMIACDEASFLVSFKSDHQLGIRKWWQLNFHLLTCHLCRKYAHQIDELNHSVEQYKDVCCEETTTHQLSNEASSKLQHVLESEINSN